MTLKIKAVGKAENLQIDRNQTEHSWTAHEYKVITRENVWMYMKTKPQQSKTMDNSKKQS